MQSQALLEAVGQRLDPFPVLRTTWNARGLSLGTGLYTSLGRATTAGQTSGVVPPGGWESIEYGSGIQGGGLLAVKTSVGVIDTDGSLLRMLQTYNPRGSVAAIDWAAPGLVATDWEPIFRGVVEDWAREGLVTRILLKTDDAVLRTPVPPAILQRYEWTAAFNLTVSGKHMPLVLGIHDAHLVTARGMLPAINIRYDKDRGYWWLASVGHQVDIRRIVFDGETQSAAEGTWWRVLRGVWGQNRLTIIEIDKGNQPEEGVIVSFDGEGPDSDGLSAGTAVTNPLTQLRKILEEYVYRDPPLGAWVGDHSIIDDTSWDAAAAFFAAHDYDCGRRFGGDETEESAAEVIQSFLDSYPWTRIDWTEVGTLAFTVIDPDDVDPPSTGLDLEAHHDGTDVPYGAGDNREVYSQIAQPYMRSAQEQKYLFSYEAHDVAALDRKVLLTIENPWSQGRFTQI